MFARTCGLVIIFFATTCFGGMLQQETWEQHVKNISQQKKPKKQKEKKEKNVVLEDTIKYHRLIQARRQGVKSGVLGLAGAHDKKITEKMSEIKRNFLNSKKTRRSSMRQRRAVTR